MIMESIYRTIYGLPQPNKTRDSSHPMQVLALGLPRTGTDSLRQALSILGYDHIYHGFDIVLSPRDGQYWSELFARKLRSDTKLTAQDFDPILGHCKALTDQPACLLSIDLMDAYPGAKIIINQRRDVNTWYESLMAITSIIESWPRWFRSLVDAEEFWPMRVIKVGWVQYFDGDYRRNGVAVYEQHYKRLRDYCKKNERMYLEWKVEDGWAPLCEFLEKEVPLSMTEGGGRQRWSFQEAMPQKSFMRQWEL